MGNNQNRIGRSQSKAPVNIYLYENVYASFKLYIYDRNKDRQIEEEAEKNDEELKFYKQKVKHLQYEHQHDLTEARAEGLVALKLAEDEHIGQERELLRDKRELKLKNIDAEVSYLDQLKSIKMV